jgi:methyl-accepting chemotaxis protein
MSRLANGVPPAGQALFDKVKAQDAGYRQQLQQFRQQMTAGQEEDAKNYLLQTLRPTQIDYIKAINNYVDFEEGLAKQVAEGTLARANSAGILLNILMAVRC